MFKITNKSIVFHLNSKEKERERDMLYFIFAVLLFAIFGNVLIFAIKATWGIAKIVFTVLLLPLFLIGLVIKGLIHLAMPVLAILGIVFLLRLKESR